MVRKLNWPEPWTDSFINCYGLFIYTWTVTHNWTDILSKWVEPQPCQIVPGRFWTGSELVGIAHFNIRDHV